MATPKHATSPQTKRALEKIVKQVAEEYGCTDDYLYAILSNFKPDPFANFKPLFKATARVELERALIWLNDLARVIEKITGKGEAPAYESVLHAFTLFTLAHIEDKPELEVAAAGRHASTLLGAFVRDLEAKAMPPEEGRAGEIEAERQTEKGGKVSPRSNVREMGGGR